LFFDQFGVKNRTVIETDTQSSRLNDSDLIAIRLRQQQRTVARPTKSKTPAFAVNHPIN
jgi:hypothetical protein